jgi:site-specific DNA-methyltransferase (cytosine-N4-specific)
MTHPLFYIGAAQHPPVAPGTIRCLVESPPYFGLRVYGDSALEPGRRGLADYIDEMVEVGKAARDVLTDDGTWWLNIGDTAANSGGAGGDHVKGSKKSIQPYRQGNMGIKGNQWGMVPWRVVMALQSDGWLLRSHIVWNKGTRHPEDLGHARRPGLQWEPIFMLAKKANYYFDHTGLVELGNVWSFGTSQGKGHAAPFPDELPRRCIRLSSEPGDLVLDRYSGSGSTARVAIEEGRIGIGGELYPEVAKDAAERENPIFF